MYDYELNSTVFNTLPMPKDIGEFYKQAREYKESILKYQCVIKEIKAKLEILNDEMSLHSDRNPIKMIKTRVKDPLSTIEKLRRRNWPVSVESMEKNLNDVAGVRIICSFIDDIYDLAEMMRSQDDVTVLEVKDYIKNPKPNGYRSYHMIVEVPIYFSCHKECVRAELQIRTIAMDFWASLEHHLRYKKEIKNSEEIKEQLRECANIIANTDERMQNILYQITEQDKEEVVEEGERD